MDLTFTKMHGIGNDFVVVEDLAKIWDLSPDAVAWLCDRHYGVGADGVILVRRSERSDADFFMLYYNADGSVAEMCGNGIRCFAKYLVDHDLVAPSVTDLVIDTLGGPKLVSLTHDGDGLLETATVDMGEPVLAAAAIPADFGTDTVLDAPLVTELGDITVTAVGMGNPHAIIWVDDVDEAPVTSLGSVVEVHERFPRHTNVEFVQVLGPDRVRMRVWERGVGETLACGTGACAVVVACALTGRT
ncbi:MAG TPA: diaminopimelate epimerase, partial [Coriobacteriia bacterium]|nr:diaminopimelate epimerase [Coriobacteriia bacterium]